MRESVIELLDLRLDDGSRQFAVVPESLIWSDFRDHLATLAGREVTGYTTDGVTEVWIDFSYSNHRFHVNNQFGEFWLMVDDPSCDDEVLLRIVHHLSLPH